MPNMGKMIKRQNKKTRLSNQLKYKEHSKYNCKRLDDCPLYGNCQTRNIVYRVVVKSQGNLDKIYIGTTECPFKQHLYNHCTSFNLMTYKNSTALIKYLW